MRTQAAPDVVDMVAGGGAGLLADGEDGWDTEAGDLDGADEDDADDLMSDDWSSAALGVAATWNDVPAAFLDAHPYAPPPKAAPGAQDVRTVGYTRESADEQTENSQPRQIANIKAYGKRTGYRLAEWYSDEGVSGTSLFGRHRFAAMMEAARRREFKVIVVEHLDRFSRSLPDILSAWEELRDLGIEIHDCKTGKLDLAHIVIMGYLGVEGRVRFLDLCKGGKRNAVAKGLVMHAPCYGYRRHPTKRGVHVVVPERAEVVRRIVGWVKAGVGCKRVADELERLKIHSPRQCQRLDGVEVPEEGSLAWDKLQVRSIVRNPIYSGWNIWGRTTPRRDRRTKRVVGHDAKPRSDWVVSRVPSLAIVGEEEQAAAITSMRSRGFAGKSSADRAGVRLLAGCMVCAVCGHPMHAGTQNDARLVYFCSDHRSSRSPRCPVASTVRLDWVERHVVAMVAADIGDVGDGEAYRERFRKAYDQGDEGRRRRLGEIDRSVARLKDDLSASYIAMVRRTGVPEEVIAEVNANLTARIEQLRGVRARLAAIPEPAEAFKALDTLGGAMAALAAAIPFKAVDPEGEVLAQRFRRFVGRIKVHPRDADGLVKLEVSPDRDRVTSPNGFKAERPAPPRVLVIDVAAEHAREAQGRHEEAYAATLEAARLRTHALPDAAWAVLEPLVRDVDLTVDGVEVDARTVLEGTLLILKTDGAITRPPPHYGDAGIFLKGLKRLIYAGAWDAGVAALRAAMPAVVAGADLARLQTTSFPRGRPKRRVGKMARWDAAETARRLAEVKAAIAAETDPVTRERLEAVRLRLQKVSPAKAAEQLGRPISFVYQYMSDYRLSDIAGVRGARAAGVERRVPKNPEKRIKDADVEALRAIIAREAAHSVVTMTRVVALCRDELGIEVGRQTVSLTLKAAGVTPRVINAGIAQPSRPVPGARPEELGPARPAPATPSPRRRRGKKPHGRRHGVA